MAIIKQGILGGFKKKIGSVVGSSWKGIATMRSLPLSVANPKTAAQVENRDRFKACAQFASLILASLIKPLMDRFAGQMSGYNWFVQTNKGVFTNPASPLWANLILSKGKMVKPNVTFSTTTSTNLRATFTPVVGDRYAQPTDKVYAMVYNEKTKSIAYQGDTGSTRADATINITLPEALTTGTRLLCYASYLREDGSEVSNSAYGYVIYT